MSVASPIGCGSTTVGFDGCFITVNPAFERILGYRKEDLIGRPFLDFVHPDDVDLDRFKQINDELGHATGDAALREVTRVLRENVRQTDILGREREVPLGVSVGVALFDEVGCPPAKELMVAADRAMYVVKAAGGGGASIESRP